MSEPTPPPEPTSAPPPPPEGEDLYQATVSILAEPDTGSTPCVGVGCLLGTLVLFGLSFVWPDYLRSLAFIIPILFLHEAGHWLGMRLFGWRNPRVFFILIFGVGLSAKHPTIPAWKQAIVYLLGPLPGLLLGLGLVFTLHPPLEQMTGEAAFWLIVVNGFNLLPLVPLDGGRLVDVLLFARPAFLAPAVRLAAVVLLALLAFTWNEWAWPLAVIAIVLLIDVVPRFRRGRVEVALAGAPVDLPPRIGDLTDSQRRELFRRVLLLNPTDRNPVGLALEVRQLHEKMVSSRASPGMAVVLLLIVVAGLAGSIAGIVELRHASDRWKVRQQEEMVAELQQDLDRIVRLERQGRLGRANETWADVVQRWKAMSPRLRQMAAVKLLDWAGDRRRHRQLVLRLQKIPADDR